MFYVNDFHLPGIVQHAEHFPLGSMSCHAASVPPTGAGPSSKARLRRGAKRGIFLRMRRLPSEYLSNSEADQPGACETLEIVRGFFGFVIPVAKGPPIH